MCDCYKKALEAIRKHYGDDELLVHPPVDFMSGKLFLEFAVIEKRPTKNNPNRTKETVTKVLADYCPYCGEPYEAQPLRGEE